VPQLPQNWTGEIMKQIHKRNWILAAALMPLLAALPAHAQFPSGNDGHALDANNRVGSGGYNAAGVRGGTGVTGNQIVNGNVTRGQAFAGGVGHLDARAFHGPTPEFGIDRFVADSAGAATRAQPNGNSFNSQAYYGDGRAVAPPQGYVPLGNSGGYTASTNAPAGYNLARSGGVINNYGAGLTGERPLGLGTTVIPGTSDDPNNQNLLLMSPLSGIQQVPLSDALSSNNYVMSQSGSYVRPSPTDRLRSSPQSIEEMRRQLEQANPDLKDANNQKAGDDQGPTKLAPGQLNNAVPQSFDSPQNRALQRGQLNSPLVQQQMASGLRSNESTQKLQGADQQTAVLSELQNRLKRYETEGAANLQEQQDKMRQQQVTKAIAGTTTATPGATGPGGRPSSKLPNGRMANGAATPGAAAAVPSTRLPAGATAGVTTPVIPAPQATRSPAARPAPLFVTSLATGVKAKGLAGLLTQAEDLMKKGKFADALAKYDTAEQVAPNNALIALGKAHAELGASSYRSADAHIRQAIASDRSLLLARYDLKTFLGNDRLAAIVKDLQELAKANPDDAIAPFLLSYINYNAGDIVQTVQYLNDAEKRSGDAPDATTSQMREMWSLPNVRTPAAIPDFGQPAPAPVNK
jgi:tetratricopeptide (TPR) repeat protein